MTREEVYEKLNDILRDTLDEEDVTEDTVSSDMDDWNSLTQIDHIVKVEQAFGIKFSMGEITAMRNVGAMVDRILAKLS